MSIEQAISSRDQALRSTKIDLRAFARRDAEQEELFTLVVSNRAALRNPLIEQLAARLPEPFSVKEESSYDRAVSLATVMRPDILIVDATRGQFPGSDFCQRLGYRAAVIFLTDNPAVAQRAFDAGAIDCLQSPVSDARLERALQRALTWIGQHRRLFGTDHVGASQLSFVDPGPRCVRIARNGDLLVAALSDIVYIQAERKVTRVVLQHTDGILRQGINSVAEKLDARQFWRIHRSTIVNFAHVSSVHQDDLKRVVVRMHGRTEVLYASRVHERTLFRDGIF